jgi:hypothetical protein
MKRKRIAALVVLLAPIVAGASSHFTSVNPPSDRHTTARDSTPCLDTLHPSDSLPAIVTMSVRPQDKKTVLPPDFEGLFAQEFKARLRAPRNLSLSVMNEWTPCDSLTKRCESGLLGIHTRAYVTAHSNGTLSRMRVIDFSLIPAFADSVRGALDRLSKESVSPFLNGLDSLPLEISISANLHPDTVAAIRQLFRVTLPHYHLPITHAAWLRDSEKPIYPRIAERKSGSSSDRSGDGPLCGFHPIRSRRAPQGEIRSRARR